jgi:CDP-glycerol glycerophosphotransferase (TagB/SpsB family)
VVITGGDKADANAIEIANYVADHYDFPVYYVVNDFFRPYSDSILSKRVKRIDTINKTRLKMIYLNSKYFISTHDVLLKRTPKNKVFVNLWHGVGHKKGWKDESKNLLADVTVATSDMTKEMFSHFFKVPIETVFISGYPRNDLMLRVQKKKEIWKEKLNFSGYDKIIIWLPTYQVTENFKFKYDGNMLAFSDIFQIDDFKVEELNEILKRFNSLCIIKPHPVYNNKKINLTGMDNLLLIDDEWIFNQGLTLYHLIGCTDILITDYSSVMTDYTLLEQPIILFTPNIESYKQTDGFYFENVEEYMPSELIFNEKDFFSYFKKVLESNSDPMESKRKKIRDIYFKYKDEDSSKRLSEHLFGKSTVSTNKIKQ